jgi:hypothetical protein
MYKEGARGKEVIFVILQVAEKEIENFGTFQMSVLVVFI